MSMSAHDRFVAGFAAATRLSARDAEICWYAWSRSSDDSERESIERGGKRVGRAEGLRFVDAERHGSVRGVSLVDVWLDGVWVSRHRTMYDAWRPGPYEYKHADGTSAVD